MSLATGGFTKFPFGRTVSESAEIQLIADSARLQWERFDDIYAALSWRLGHDGPELGQTIFHDGSECRLFKLAGANGEKPVPSVTVLFKVLPNEIEIIGLKVEAPFIDDEEEFV